jgi:hypothetical protein
MVLALENEGGGVVNTHEGRCESFAWALRRMTAWIVVVWLPRHRQRRGSWLWGCNMEGWGCEWCGRSWVVSVSAHGSLLSALVDRSCRRSWVVRVGAREMGSRAPWCGVAVVVVWKRPSWEVTKGGGGDEHRWRRRRAWLVVVGRREWPCLGSMIAKQTLFIRDK